MTFPADYPGAIVVEAANYGYNVPNVPKGFVYHTPEEKADDDPQTPGYIAGTTREASYTYFDSFLGFIFQLVPESEGAYANAVTGKPYPSWANPTVNLNLQGISVSFEGFAHNIHLTMLRGSPQWSAGVKLVAHRAKALGINPRNWARHKDVSVNRSDTGQLDVEAFTKDVVSEMEEEMIEPHYHPKNDFHGGRALLIDGLWRFPLDDAKHHIMHQIGSRDVSVDDSFGALPLYSPSGSGNGLGFNETVAASAKGTKQALKEGVD
jgi:hypothetical protein